MSGSSANATAFQSDLTNHLASGFILLAQDNDPLSRDSAEVLALSSDDSNEAFDKFFQEIHDAAKAAILAPGTGDEGASIEQPILNDPTIPADQKTTENR